MNNERRTAMGDGGEGCVTAERTVWNAGCRQL